MFCPVVVATGCRICRTNGVARVEALLHEVCVFDIVSADSEQNSFSDCFTVICANVLNHCANYICTQFYKHLSIHLNISLVNGQFRKLMESGRYVIACHVLSVHIT